MISETPTHAAPAGARVTRFVVVAAAVSALGGFLFGFDTGIISGALLSMRDDLALSEVAKQTVVSSLLLGAIGGAFVGGPAADRFGRRPTVLTMAVVFFGGAMLAALASGILGLGCARVLLGIAVGVASAVIPVYIAEIAPARFRGVLVAMQEFMITLGILCSYLVSYVLEPSGNWRLMLGSAVIPAAALFIGMLLLPESPRWLMGRNRDDEALRVLRRACSSEQEVTAELEAIQTERSVDARVRWRDLLAPAVRPALVVAVGLAFFNQMVGINVVIYYAPTILSYAGLGDSAAILATVGVGATMVVATGLALAFVDRIGRRPLFIWGSVGMAAALFLMGAAFLVPERQGLRAVLLIAGLLVYIAAFSPSMGLFWVLIAEVFPAPLRSKGSAAGSITHWVMNFVVASTILTLISAITATGALWLYGAFTVACAIFVWKTLPETKGKTLEVVAEELVARSKDPRGTTVVAR